MKVIKILGGVIVSLVISYCIVAVVAPKGYNLSRKIAINSSIDIVFKQTSFYKNWGVWSPWAKKDTSANFTFTNDIQKVGSMMSWVGADSLIGSGSLTTTKIIVNEQFEYQMKFIKPWESNAKGGFLYTINNDSVVIEWYSEGDYSFFQRPMMLLMDMNEMIGNDFEQGLMDLKNVCENKKEQPALKIIETHVKSTPILFIAQNSPLIADSIGAKLTSSYAEIMTFLKKNNLQMLGYPMAITNKFSFKEKIYNFDAAIPFTLEKDIVPTGRIQIGKTFSGKVLKATYVGPYESSIAAYTEIITHIQLNNLDTCGRSWEEYPNDPSVVEPKDLITNIYFPIK